MKQIYVRSIAIFKDASDEFCDKVLNLFERKPFAKGDVLATDGSDTDCIIYISSGEVAIEVAGTVVATLKQGANFGDMAIVRDTKRAGTIRANTEGVSYILRKESLLTLLQEDTVEATRIRSLAEPRVSSSDVSTEKRELPAERQLKQYFDALRAHGSSEQKPETPDNVRQDIGDLFAQGGIDLALFGKCSSKFIADMSSRLEPRTYPEGVRVFEEGQEGEEMFWIFRGSVGIIRGSQVNFFFIYFYFLIFIFFFFF